MSPCKYNIQLFGINLAPNEVKLNYYCNNWQTLVTFVHTETLSGGWVVVGGANTMIYLPRLVLSWYCRSGPLLPVKSLSWSLCHTFITLVVLLFQATSPSLTVAHFSSHPQPTGNITTFPQPKPWDPTGCVQRGFCSCVSLRRCVFTH